MKDKKEYTGIELMDTAPVGTAIRRLAAPMMVAMLSQAVYNLTGVFFIGQTHDPNMIAAVALAFPLFMLVQAVGNIFAIGGASYISRMLGAKNEGEARRTSSVSFYTVLGIGILMTVVLWIFRIPIVRLLGASDATFHHTEAYVSIIVLSMAFATTGIVMSGIMRSEGATKEAMNLQLIGIIINIILDPILILWCKMGTAGAAWATVVGTGVSFVYGLRYFALKKSILSISLSDCKPNRVMLADTFSIGVPAGISNLAMSFSMIVGNRIAAGYGDFVVGGLGVQMRIASIFFMVVMAIAFGFQPFAGFNYGAKQFGRLRKGFNLTIIFSTALCVAGSCVLGLFGADTIRFFIDDAQTIEAGGALMKAFIWGLPFFGVQITLLVSFQALGKPVQAMIITLGRQLLIYIPLLYLLSYLFGFNGFVWALPVSDILMTGIAVALGASLIKLMRGAEAAP